MAPSSMVRSAAYNDVESTPDAPDAHSAADVSSRVWRHSPHDAWLVALPALQLALTLGWALTSRGLPLALNVALIVPMAVLFYFNPIVATHNFLHTPFFRSQRANELFSSVNSINLGLPQILYRVHHLLHHRYGNDPIANGTTQDPSSTYRFGKQGQQEHWVSYCALGLLRDGTSVTSKEAIRRGEGATLLRESVASAAGWVAWLAIDWRFALCFWLPTFFFGWFLAHAENYFEHFRAKDVANRFANSVSYYGRWYNVLMFNEGYHQEHHIEPGRHWTLRPSVHERHRDAMTAAGATVSSVPPLLGMFERS
jgi:fatty acid desaturase